jgi:hypothetical protein
VPTAEASFGIKYGGELVRVIVGTVLGGVVTGVVVESAVSGSDERHDKLVPFFFFSRKDLLPLLPAGVISV